MPLQTHVFRRGAYYYHRIRVPFRLRALFGRADLTKSLQTAEAILARRKGALLSAGFTSFFREVTLKMHKLTKADVEELARAFYARLLREDAQDRFTPDTKLDWRNDPRAQWHLENMGMPDRTPEQVVASSSLSAAELVKDDEDFLDRDHWQTIIQTRDYVETDTLVAWLLEGTGLRVEPGSSEYRQLGVNAARALVEAKTVAIARASGQLGADSTDILFRGVTESYETTLDPKKRTTIGELIPRFMSERHTNSPTYTPDYNGTIGAFFAFFGDARPVSAFSRADIVAFKDALRTLPTRYKKKYPGATLHEAIERNKKDKNPTIKARTINDKYLCHLTAIFGWAAANGYIADNVASGVSVDLPKSRMKDKPRVAFSIPDLRTLFSSPLFVGCESERSAYRPGRRLIRDHRYWLPLLGLFTGARLGELGQLLVKDIREEGGRHFLVVETGSEEDGDFVKRIKTDDSDRYVPIHSELIQLGFLAYVQSQKKKKHVRLFPELPRDQRGSFSTFTKWFGRYLGKIEIKTAKTSFHSFRHGFEDLLREHVKDEELRRVLAGRAFNHSAVVYGEGFSVERLSQEVAKIQYPGLDLTHLRVPEAR